MFIRFHYQLLAFVPLVAFFVLGAAPCACSQTLAISLSVNEPTDGSNPSAVLLDLFSADFNGSQFFLRNPSGEILTNSTSSFLGPAPEEFATVEEASSELAGTWEILFSPFAGEFEVESTFTISPFSSSDVVEPPIITSLQDGDVVTGDFIIEGEFTSPRPSDVMTFFLASQFDSEGAFVAFFTPEALQDDQQLLFPVSPVVDPDVVGTELGTIVLTLGANRSLNELVTQTTGSLEVDFGVANSSPESRIIIGVIAVPEPTSGTILLGLMGTLLYRRRRETVPT